MNSPTRGIRILNALCARGSIFSSKIRINFFSSTAVMCAVGLCYTFGRDIPSEAAEKPKEKALPSTFFWGRGSFFGLADRNVPLPLEDFDKYGLRKMVLRESAGVGAALTRDSRVLLWSSSGSASVPIELKLRDVVDIVCSRSGRFLSLDKWGQVHTWTRSEPQPKLLAGLPREKITQIAAGAEHFGLLTASGGVLMWGTNMHGQLGSASHESLQKPTPVSGLKKRITKIALGDNHSVLLDSEGKVMTFGANYFCQLGQRKEPWEHDGLGALPRPAAVPFLKKKPVRDIVCGQDFTLAVTESGELVSWGFGRWGQLADGHMRHMKTPPGTAATTPFAKGGARHLRQLTCGDHHCLALMEGGAVWSWGLNSNGQLGNGSVMPRAEPQPVTSLINANISAVLCSENSSIAIE